MVYHGAWLTVETGHRPVSRRPPPTQPLVKQLVLRQSRPEKPGPPRYGWIIVLDLVDVKGADLPGPSAWASTWQNFVSGAAGQGRRLLGEAALAGKVPVLAVRASVSLGALRIEIA